MQEPTKVVIYGPFEVAPEWQEHIPDQFGVSLFDKWRWHVEDALRALAGEHRANREQIAPGYKYTVEPYTIEFHESTFNLYWGAILLARVDCFYESTDEQPNPPARFSPTRTRGDVPPGR